MVLMLGCYFKHIISVLPRNTRTSITVIRVCATRRRSTRTCPVHGLGGSQFEVHKVQVVQSDNYTLLVTCKLKRK